MALFTAIFWKIDFLNIIIDVFFGNLLTCGLPLFFTLLPTAVSAPYRPILHLAPKRLFNKIKKFLRNFGKGLDK